ncbi:hypothetical protein BU15DRAFT_86056 [Melanogaster broomeanus]|nr:hypothetical protein BU15DRAFT_86056 [Melanogaster broomeanus]
MLANIFILFTTVSLVSGTVYVDNPLDDVMLTFHGTPAAGDEGTAQITITADDTEFSASSSFILCVTSYAAPTLHQALSQQFYAGNPDLASVFVLGTGIGLDEDTYTSPYGLSYGALLSDGTPLPEWIKFDASSLTFDGYSAGHVPFDLVVATHELSALSSLPTVNITAGMPFNVAMSSAADFSGVLVDGQPIQPANVSVLSVDVSSYRSWLTYDPERKTLYGLLPNGFTASDGRPVLPVTLTSNFNQTLNISMALNIVLSYFSKSDLGTIQADPGQRVQFNLEKFFANPFAQHSDVNLSASFYPSGASSYLTFDPVMAQLTGQIPADSDTPICRSDVRRLFPHYSLHLTRDAFGGTEQVTLILSIVFGIVGGLCLLGLALALFRYCAMVKDPVILGEAGTRARTGEENRWYGIGNEARHPDDRLETQANNNGPHPQNLANENLGLELRRVSPHLPSTRLVHPSRAEGVRKKYDFLARIRDTARNVGDRYGDRYKRRPPCTRWNVNDPAPQTSGRQHVEMDGYFGENEVSTPASFTSSPSDSTGERSIPRRRADFAPPRWSRGSQVPAPAAMQYHNRRSLVMESSQSTSGVSAAHADEFGPGEDRPRSTEFTRASWVPTSRSPLSNTVEQEVSLGARRVTGQAAQVLQTRSGTSHRHRRAPHRHALRSHIRRRVIELESSQHGIGAMSGSKENETSRFLVCTGEKFKFRVSIRHSSNRYRKLEARLISGRALPLFICAELKGFGGKVDERKAVEFYGVPTEGDVGELHIGVFNVEGDECLARVIVEVVARNKRFPPLAG